jgi:hypothetical protein
MTTRIGGFACQWRGLEIIESSEVLATIDGDGHSRLECRGILQQVHRASKVHSYFEPTHYPVKATATAGGILIAGSDAPAILGRRYQQRREGHL